VVEAWLYYTVAGLLGGLASALIWAERWEDLMRFESARALILGGIGGYLFFMAHSEWSIPDGVVAFTWGYVARDVFEALAEKARLLLKSRVAGQS
jgi:hypothetical protein